MIHVEPEDLAEERPQVLSVPVGITPGASVTHADIQHAVGAEGELSSVVVFVGLCVGEELDLAGRITFVRIILARNKLRDDRAPGRIGGVVQEEETVFTEPGVERQPEEPFLIPLAVDAVRDVQKDLCLPDVGPILEDIDAAPLLDHEQAV